MYLIAILAPLVYCCDTKNMLSLGFRPTGPSMQETYKFRPDYASGMLFAAKRVDMTTFKSFNH